MKLARVLAAGALTLGLAATSATAYAAPGKTPPGQQKAGHYSFAVIGDVPYGQDQIAAFPGWVEQINAAKPAMTFHVGDIKNGSTRCDDAYYQMIKRNFDAFHAPLIYTPGDNEWTDCHRDNNGAYQPLERLAYDRSVFFAQPGKTLGQKPAKVRSQAALGFPEIVSLREQRVTFASLHVVGSNDDLKPWTGIGETAPTAEQLAEQRARMDANLALLRESFAQAAQRNDRAVAIFLQADMFDPSVKEPKLSDYSAFKPLVQELIDLSNAFDGEVYLFDGDSHVFTEDQPLAAGSKWLDFYGVTGSSNLQRITVDGSENNVDWLKVTVNRPNAGRVLSWEQVPYTK